MASSTTYLIENSEEQNSLIPPCNYSKCPQCNTTAYHIVITTLSCLIGVLVVLLVASNRMYKHEQNQRLTMWKVKWEDIIWDKNKPYTPIMPQKKFSTKMSTGKRHFIHRRHRNVFTTVGYFKGKIVAVKQLRARRLSLDRPRLGDLDQVFMLNHDHVCKFYGANHAGQHVTVLTEYCTRGSLRDLLKDKDDWDDVFKNSLIFDIVKGMLYLHRSPIHSHGNLKPSNCLIDSRFMVKLTDFGMIGQRLKVRKTTVSHITNDSSQRKLWTAPELLRAVITPPCGTQEGDVYSFSIIAQEILYQRGPFYRKEDNYSSEEIIHFLTSYKVGDVLFRPALQDDDDVIIDQQWRKVLRHCWSENCKERPGFQEIHQVASGLQRDTTLVDSLIQRLQQYSNRLEEKVEEKTEQYRAEKEKSDSLLYQMLPKSVAERLKMNTEVMPESYDSVTVYFSDIVGFSAICHDSAPLDIVQMLNDLYTMFDQVIDEFDVYKVETIGDAYMVVSGLPVRNQNNHASEIARMALSLRESVSNFQISHMPNEKLKLRVGIHTGPVVAGVVGLKMPRYCLYGDTVNTAARMEQHGEALKIHVSPHTKDVLEQFGTFQLEKRRETVTLKGLGKWETYWLLCEQDSGRFSEYPQIHPRSIFSTQFSTSSETALVIDDVTLDDVTGCSDVFSSSDEMKRANSNIYERRRVPDKVPRYKTTILTNSSKQRRMGTVKQPSISFGVGPLHSLAETTNKIEINQINTGCDCPHHSLNRGRDSGVSMAFDNDSFAESAEFSK